MPDSHDLTNTPPGSFYYYLRRPKRGYHDSIDEWEKSIRTRIDSGELSEVDGLWELVDVHKENGDTDAIRECITEILDLNPDSEMSARCHHAFGCLAEQCSDYPSAVLHYRIALSFLPANDLIAYWVHNNLGYSLCMLSNFAEAAIECNKAIVIDPTRHNAHKNLGIALAGLGDNAEAAKCFYRATKANAADPRSLKLLEELYQEHPELNTDIQGFKDMLDDCRLCVNTYDSLRNNWC